jgi:hypothetical protein
MDGPRFDNLTKSLVAATPSRREALRRLVGGAVAAVFGGAVLNEAGAQVGTEAYDLTCKQDGTRYYCLAGTTPGNLSTCRSDEGCICARRKGGGGVCIKEPSTGCPTKRNKCRRGTDCTNTQACIVVPECCPNSPTRGKCVEKCPA